MNNKVIERFQFITNGSDPEAHIRQITNVCEGGCRWVQLRMKDIDESVFLNFAGKVKVITDKFFAKLIINDNVDIAREVGAAGVHLGINDMDIDKARRIMGSNYIIGGTANTLSDAVRASSGGADYIGLGPYRYTTTKQKLSPVLGITGFTSIIKQLEETKISTPVISIGGIEEEDIDLILQAGLYGIAVSSVITNAEDMVLKTKSITDKIKNYFK
jgi:thiamine-phosphate pyrophosphorylase